MVSDIVFITKCMSCDCSKFGSGGTVGLELKPVRIQVRLPRVKSDQYELPKTCPHGFVEGGVFSAMGAEDCVSRCAPQVSEVPVCRYRCVNCERTFREYPKGVPKGAQ